MDRGRIGSRADHYGDLEIRISSIAVGDLTWRVRRSRTIVEVVSPSKDWLETREFFNQIDDWLKSQTDEFDVIFDGGVQVVGELPIFEFGFVDKNLAAMFKLRFT